MTIENLEIGDQFTIKQDITNTSYVYMGIGGNDGFMAITAEAHNELSDGKHEFQAYEIPSDLQVKKSEVKNK